jgi:acyl-CoA reductase-like NAD-dependent aldehyde dehydrogenase
MANISLPKKVVEENESRRVIIRYTPLGVVNTIIPWNFPLSLRPAR